jgi:hypothetical protein
MGVIFDSLMSEIIDSFMITQLKKPYHRPWMCFILLTRLTKAQSPGQDAGRHCSNKSSRQTICSDKPILSQTLPKKRIPLIFRPGAW